MGINAAAGYGALAVAALLTGFIASEEGLRPAPFFFGLACAGLGLGLSALFVRDTGAHVALEQSGLSPAGAPIGRRPTWLEVFAKTSFHNPSMSAASQAGQPAARMRPFWLDRPLHVRCRGRSIAE